MFKLFEIGFIQFTFVDILDISIVAFVLYKLYYLIRGTIAFQVLLGLISVFILYIAAQAINLQTVKVILKFVTDIWIIAFLILFQQEIRQLLVLLGSNPFIRKTLSLRQNDVISSIVNATYELAQRQHGAIMAVKRSITIPISGNAPEMLNANISKALLETIFFPKSPLHDGAVIINGDKIEYASVGLFPSGNDKYEGENLGMRHRAAIGASEQTDALVIVVSEETGSISIAERGILKRGISRELLRQKLLEIYPDSANIPVFKKIKQSIASSISSIFSKKKSS